MGGFWDRLPKFFGHGSKIVGIKSNEREYEYLDPSAISASFGREDQVLASDTNIVTLVEITITDFTKCLIFYGGSLQKKTLYSLVSPTQIKCEAGNMTAGQLFTVVKF